MFVLLWCFFLKVFMKVEKYVVDIVMLNGLIFG